VSRSWIVGGALRDELLGREVTDIDIAVERDPQQAARELAAELRGPVFQLSEAFGAWRVVDRREGRVYDFAPLQGDTIEDDLARRDFSVNAMARPLEQGSAAAAPTAGGELIDPLGGRADIEARTLRVLGPAA
jgi:poly(A) polymerase